ncbi:MAG: hypothetical protein Q9227_004703 [Pyrenula ochraceoflavens]
MARTQRKAAVDAKEKITKIASRLGNSQSAGTRRKGRSTKSRKRQGQGHAKCTAENLRTLLMARDISFKGLKKYELVLKVDDSDVIVPDAGDWRKIPAKKIRDLLRNCLDVDVSKLKTKEQLVREITRVLAAKSRRAQMSASPQVQGSDHDRADETQDRQRRSTIGSSRSPSERIKQEPQSSPPPSRVERRSQSGIPQSPSPHTGSRRGTPSSGKQSSRPSNRRSPLSPIDRSPIRRNRGHAPSPSSRARQSKSPSDSRTRSGSTPSIPYTLGTRSPSRSPRYSPPASWGTPPTGAPSSSHLPPTQTRASLQTYRDPRRSTSSPDSATPQPPLRRSRDSASPGPAPPPAPVPDIVAEMQRRNEIINRYVAEHPGVRLDQVRFNAAGIPEHSDDDDHAITEGEEEEDDDDEEMEEEEEEEETKEDVIDPALLEGEGGQYPS